MEEKNEIISYTFRRFFEIFVSTPLDVCEKRDVKGLYKLAREGKIQGFTGIDQAYEEPKNADLKLSTENAAILESTYGVIELLEQQHIIPRNLREIEVVSVLCTDCNFVVAVVVICSLILIMLSCILYVLADTRIVRFAQSNGGDNSRSNDIAITGNFNG